MSLSAVFMEDLKEAFEIFDKEKTGRIDKYTLGAVLRSMGQNPSEAELTDIFGSVAGEGHKVDVAGMLKAAEAMAAKMGSEDHEASLIEAFKVFDKENSGRLAAAEIKHMMRDINFQINEDEMDEMMEEIQDSAGTVDYKHLAKLMFKQVDTQPAEREQHRRKMAEVKSYFNRNHH
mmetsp:Transcript_15154/g.37914  ORF Transcript_15154/g.37914 Transcript_15154/m.37914 type:complete len:176 (+) Transcript_15154:2-529(+)